MRREPEKPKLRSITFIKQRLQWLKSVWLFPSSGKSNYMFCSAQNKFSSQPTLDTFHPLKDGWWAPPTGEPRRAPRV